MKLRFLRIYIFDSVSRKAFSTDFKEGINVITSSDIDGNDRGKSVRLRSLYHALGADAHYDDKWQENNKIYTLKFSIDKEIYYLYRSRSLFKVFDGNRNMVFTTIHRTELAEYIKELFGFSMYLPQKTNEKLSIAPPVFTYLLSFIDQDKYNGTKFDSFKRLEQFSNIKPNVIYSHLGLYNKDYFITLKEKEKYEEQVKNASLELEYLQKMQNKISDLLQNVYCPETIEALNNDLRIKSRQYSNLLIEMNEVRLKLIELRNQLKEQDITLNQISKYEQKNEKEIDKIKKMKICPECNSTLEDTLIIRSRRYNQIDSALNIRDSIKVDIEKIKNEITKLENQYSSLVIKLKEYNDTLKESKKEIDDYARFKGLNELNDNLNLDIIANTNTINDANTNLKTIKLELKKINGRKKTVDEQYYIMIDRLKMRFNLNELEGKNYEKITGNFCASGSNKPVSTIIWYITLQELIRKFNPKRIELPMVFDSPNNAETDAEKKQALIQYILESADNYDQLILSAIGFKKEEYEVIGNININYLDNDKYSLLNEATFSQFEDLLVEMNKA